MRCLNRSTLRRFAPLVLATAIPLGLTGCGGAELAAIEPFAEGMMAVGAGISIAHDLQEMEAARLERERRQQWEWQMRNGGMTTFQPQYPYPPAPAGNPPGFQAVPAVYPR
jgi:hypothetical protein